MAELSIFYCEEAFGFLESCSMEDESYFAALIRMYGRSLEFVSSLPAAERGTYHERLDKLFRLESRTFRASWPHDGSAGAFDRERTQQIDRARDFVSKLRQLGDAG